MKTLLTHSDLSCDSTLPHAGRKWQFAEPIFAVIVAFFWLIALPCGAAVLALVKVWDTCVALVAGHCIRPNPLILRVGPAPASQAQTSTQAAQA